MASSTNIPSFEPPSDNSDHEIWLVRAPVHLDASELLNGVALEVNLDASSNDALSRFKSGDNSQYALTLRDANESENVRLLVPENSSAGDEDDGESLIPCRRPFARTVHLTQTDGRDAQDHDDLVVAPSTDAAPKPAVGESGKNGSVDHVRVAYIPVPQRQGLKRRWAMPGSANNARVDGGNDETPREKKKKKVTISDDEMDKAKGVKSSSKKKKKEKKSKKSKK